MLKLIENAEILDTLIDAQSLEEVIQEEQNAFFEEENPKRKKIFEIRISKYRQLKTKFLTILN